MRRTVLFLLALVLLAAGGGWLIAGAGDGPSRTHVTVAGVPLEVVLPADGGPHPGVVVAHGYSGSATLMAPFGDTLAAAGYAVVLLDFTGHGANPAPFPDQVAGTDETTAALQRDLDVALTHLGSLPGVEESRVALVGHSMGAGVVTRYAAAHPDVTATVAISLPDAFVASAERPARLLTVAGALEFPDFRSVATSVAAQRDDRAVRIVPGVEHISVLYAPETHRATVDWLDEAFGRPRHDGPLPFPGRRLAGTTLLVLALLLGFYPLVARLSGTAAAPWRAPGGPGLGEPGPGGRALGEPGPGGPGPGASGLGGRVRTMARIVAVAVMAAGVGAVTARFLPVTRLPVAILGYVTGYAAVTGGLLLAYARRRPEPAARRGRAVSRNRVLLAVPYAVVAIAVPVHLGATHAWPVGDRWWVLPVVWAAFTLFAYAAERVAGGVPLHLVAIAAVFVIVLAVAAVVGLTHSFVILALFPLVGLLLWQALWSAFLNRFAVPTWIIAVTGAVVVTWPLAVTLPLAGP